MAGLGLHSHYFKKRGSLVNSLKEKILEKLKSGIKVRGGALLVVSGGSTPRVLFEELSKCKLDWRLVTILLADERWISAEDANSNESLVRTTLLKNHAAAAKFVSFLDYYPDLKMTESKIALTLGNLPSYDAVILGMGLDGHTASIFPLRKYRAIERRVNHSEACSFYRSEECEFSAIYTVDNKIAQY
jgi:6-phosphogluconolactonase